MLHSKDLSFNSRWSCSACLVKQGNQTLCICKYLECWSTNKKFTKFLCCSPFKCPGFKFCLPPSRVNICQFPACEINWTPTILILLCQYSYPSSAITYFMCLLSFSKYLSIVSFVNIKCLLVLIFPFETTFFIHEVIQNCWHLRKLFNQSFIPSNHTKK